MIEVKGKKEFNNFTLSLDDELMLIAMVQAQEKLVQKDPKNEEYHLY